MVLTIDGSPRSSAELSVGCPTVIVSCAREDCYRSPFYFKAQMSGAELDQRFSYRWSVTTGRIVDGQGTASIMAVVDDLRSITATVEVKGLPAECGTAVASISVIIEPPLPVRAIDEFGSLPFQKLKFRLDQLAYQLRNEPGARGYIVSSGKWTLSARATRYLITEYGFEPGRIVYIQKKAKLPLIITLYVVPAGSVPPNI